MFGANISNSSHSTNKTQNIYVLEKDFVQGKATQQFMLKRFTRIILESKVKSSYCHYTIMVIILIYL